MAKEPRLIDANGSYTLNECNEAGYSLGFGGGFIDVYDPKGKYICQFWAGDAPTVDAVPVVYCKDCARCKKGYCTIRKDSWGATLMVGQHDYCSDGERRTDNGC